MNQSTTRDFPMPNDTHPDGTVVASVWYRDDDEFQLATILVLRPEPPYFRVGVWDIERQEWDGVEGDRHFEDHMNIVPAITGENRIAIQRHDGHHPHRKEGYVDMGGDY